jgi:hypothetical protein
MKAYFDSVENCPPIKFSLGSIPRMVHVYSPYFCPFEFRYACLTWTGQWNMSTFRLLLNVRIFYALRTEGVVTGICYVGEQLYREGCLI